MISPQSRRTREWPPRNQAEIHQPHAKESIKRITALKPGSPDPSSIHQDRLKARVIIIDGIKYELKQDKTSSSSLYVFSPNRPRLSVRPSVYLFIYSSKSIRSFAIYIYRSARRRRETQGRHGMACDEDEDGTGTALRCSTTLSDGGG